jgi:hypothetical protein
MFSIQSTFIGDFKLGDNIAYNLDVLEVLYERFEAADADEKRLLCKPITVLLVGTSKNGFAGRDVSGGAGL